MSLKILEVLENPRITDDAIRNMNLEVLNASDNYNITDNGIKVL